MITRVASQGFLAQGDTAILNGVNVRSDDWAGIVNTLNWLNACGGTLVCAHTPSISESGTDTKTLRWRVKPRGYVVARAWVFHAAGSTGIAEIEVRAPASSVAATATIRAPALTSPNALTGVPFIVIEEVADPSEEELSISFTPVSGGALIPTVQCIELPRQSLGETAVDVAAVHPQTLAPGQRIQNRGTVHAVNGAMYSVAGVARASEAAAINARRAALFSWSVAEEDATAYSSTTPVTWALTRVLARKIDVAETQRVVRVAVRCEITGGGGTIEFQAESGDTVTITADGTGVAGDEPPWYFADLEVDVDDHDNDSYGQTGRLGGDLLGIEYAAVSGGSIKITSVHIHEYDDVDE